MRHAVIAHVFHIELWPDLRAAIMNFIKTVENVDVFVSYPVGKPEIGALVFKDLPAAVLFPVENRGWDVMPFLHILKRIDIDDYFTITKLHTKRDVPVVWINFWPYFGGDWRQRLLRFCSSVRNVRKSIAMFVDNDRLGMVAAPEMVTPIVAGDGKTEMLAWVRREIGRLCGADVTPLVKRGTKFVAGTVFMARASLLKPLRDKVSLEEFEEVNPDRHDLMTKAHLYECLFGAWTAVNGYRINMPSVCGAMVVVRRWILKPVSVLRHMWYAHRAA